MEHQRTFAVDIETAPNEGMIDRLPEPEVKLGNLKDPAKINAKKAESKEKQILDMALNPLWGKIISIGTYGDIKEVYTLEDEKELIRIFFEDILCPTKNYADTIVTYNGINFDFPYIYKRALILGNNSPKKPLSYWSKRYSTNPHVDLMQIWSNWSYNYAKLDDVAIGVLGKEKIDIGFSTFPELMKTQEGRDKISEYCLYDCKLTYNLYKKCQGVLFY